MRTQEGQLHLFIGNTMSNIKCSLTDFERGFDFDSVLHWDVSFCGKVRYIIYRRRDGVLVAWYDVIKKCGYSSEFVEEEI